MLKNLILLFILLFSIKSNSQNLITNGNFESESISPWTGFKNQIVTDAISNSNSGNINNGDGSLVQSFSVTEETTYNVTFKYRWVSAGGTAMTVRVIDGESGGNDLETFTLATTVDTWHDGSFSFTAPSGITTARISFYKANGNRPLRIDDVSILSDEVVPENTLVDPLTPINSVPTGVNGNWNLDFSDEFSGNTLASNKWTKNISTKSRNPRANLGVSDWWWVEENAFLDGNGYLKLRGTKVDYNTMNCGSVSTKSLYDPKYCFIEARMKIASTAKGNHTALWLQGYNQGNVDGTANDGAEVDVFESAWTSNTTKAVVHIDGYGADHKANTKAYTTPGIHSGFHTYGINWTETGMDIYYDGVLKTSYSGIWVPQVKEWIWLSVGASFGDGDFQSQNAGTLSDAEVDYVRVYKSSDNLSIKNSILDDKFTIYPTIASNSINIQTEELNYTLSIYQINGRLLHSAEYSKSQIIDVNQFSKGMHLIKINSNNTFKTYKVIFN